MSEADEEEMPMTATTFPVTIPAEVSSYVATHGVQSVLEDILEGLPRVFPDLSSIECEVDPGYPDEMDPSVLITTMVPNTPAGDATPLMRWIEWELARYPGRTLAHFTMHFVPQTAPDDRS